MQNSMYYTTSGLTSLPAYQGGGYLDQYGRQQYGLGKLVKKITKPIANVLDKIVPNEIKPALPYVAAFAPFMFPGFTAGLGSLLGGSGTIAGLSIPEMLGAGVLKAGADLSQEGAAKRGLNPLTLGATMISAGLAAPGSAERLASNQILGNISPSFSGIDDIGQLGYNTSAANQAFTAADAAKVAQTFGPESSMLPPNSILTPPTSLQSAQNLVNTGLTSAAKLMEVPEGGISILNNPIEAAKKLSIPTITTASEQAYITAQKALDEYNSKLGNIQNMKSADLAERRNAVIKYMQLAGFGQSDIDSALSRSGLKDGGQPTKQKTIPISLDGIAKELFNNTLDNLSYTQKETVYEQYYDRKDKKAKGGRIGYEDGGPISLGMELYLIAKKTFEEQGYSPKEAHEKALEASGIKSVVKEYGPGVKKAKGGIMNLGGKEMDLRAAGGFVPIGRKERADDVPARLSKNEFVFTAKAVRNAGGGDIRKGAKKMYQIMKQLEARS